MTRRDATSDTAVIVLAAGAGSRFRDLGHKLTAELPETIHRPRERVADRAIATALEAAIGRVIVVTGRLDATDLALDGRTDLDTVHNSNWEHGQMTSVHSGIDAAAALDAHTVVIGLADQPGITAEAWRDVAAQAIPSHPIAVATYDSKRANPVALHRTAWGLLDHTGDEGARGLMRLRPDLVVEVPCSGSPNDIDTVEDLAKWQNN
ncbi:MAG: NTP transferase domain-containing protein [Ilumatobacter sp.]